MIRAIVCSVVIVIAGLGLAPSAFAERPYANCTEAHDDGRWDIPQDDAAYWDGGDRDHDGYACDS